MPMIEGAKPVRTVHVAPERLGRWIDTFGDRHGPLDTSWSPERAVITAADGASASILIPFPPLPADGLRHLATHVRQDRTIGALLIRRGGVAVGVFAGRRLEVSKIETAYVQSRTKAGGWSQQRYARRRGNQARALTDEAIELVVRLVLPLGGELAGLATGGDKPSVSAVLADPRLEPLRSLVLPRVHPVPDPRLAVLQAFPDQFLAVEIELNELA